MPLDADTELVVGVAVAVAADVAPVVVVVAPVAVDVSAYLRAGGVT